MALTRENSDTPDEQRFVSLGMDAIGRLLVVIYTYRRNEIRLISAAGRQLQRKGKTMKAEYRFSKAKRGAVVPQTGKTRITMYLDDPILEEFRRRADAAGKGYQTMINDALREYLAKDFGKLEETLRRVIREEMGRAA